MKPPMKGACTSPTSRRTTHPPHSIRKVARRPRARTKATIAPIGTAVCADSTRAMSAAVACVAGELVTPLSSTTRQTGFTPAAYGAYGSDSAPFAVQNQAIPAIMSGRDVIGIAKTGSCQPFRHTAATQMLENGADIRFIRALLGHEGLETTTIYTQVSISKLTEIHAATHPGARLGRSESDPGLD